MFQIKMIEESRMSRILEIHRQMQEKFRKVSKKGEIVKYLGKKFVVYPSVFWPHEDSKAIVKNYNIEIKYVLIEIIFDSLLVFCLIDKTTMEFKLEKYCNLCPSFINTAQHKLLIKMFMHIKDGDMDKFKNLISNSIIKFNTSETKLLVELKYLIMSIVNDEQDLLV